MKIEAAFKVENGRIVPFNIVMEEYLHNNLKEGDVFSGALTINHGPSTRSVLQNSAMWLFNTKIANALNDSGQDMRVFLKEGYFVSWSKYTVKEHIWNTISKALFDTDKSSSLNSKQFYEVGEMVGIRMATNKRIVVNWPSRDSLMTEQIDKE
jgi:hypothetical protein